MQAVLLSEVVGPDHVWILDARPEARLAQEALDCRRIGAETLSEYLDGHRAVLVVPGAVNRSGAALAHALEESISGQGSAGQIFGRHSGGKLMLALELGQVAG